MSWDKGAEREKDVREKDFAAAVGAMTDALTRYPPNAGIAATAYIVASILVTMKKSKWDNMVDFYTLQIKDDIIKELGKIPPHKIKEALRKVGK
jgi:hypothetical protein